MAVFMDREYMAAKGATTNNIYVKYQNSAGIWSPWEIISGSTGKSPALAAFNDKLYIAVRGAATSNIFLCSMDASENWGPSWTQIPGGTSEAPALTVFDNRLYLFVKGAATTVVRPFGAVSWHQTRSSASPELIDMQQLFTPVRCEAGSGRFS